MDSGWQVASNRATPPGLVNRGNACYTNVAMQAFMALQYFRRKCQTFSNSVNGVQAALYEFYQRYQQRECGQVQDICTTTLRYTLATASRQYEEFADNHEHDAMDFMQAILDTCSMLEDFQVVVQEKFSCLACTAEWEDAFDTLPYLFLVADGDKNLETLLREGRFRREKRCGACGREGRAYSFLNIPQAPSQLIIRFGMFEEGPPMSNATPNLRIGGMPYRVVAVIKHIGYDRDHGHFVACVRRGDTWWRCSDSNITPWDISVREQIEPGTDRRIQIAYMILEKATAVQEAPQAANVQPDQRQQRAPRRQGEKETPEERERRLAAARQKYAEKRASETPEERERRLQQARQKYAEKRTNDKPEERERRLQDKRQQEAARRNAETEQQQTARLRAAQEHMAERRATETTQQRDARLHAQRVAQSQLRAEETPQQRDARLHAQRVAQSQLRAEETPQQRDARLHAQRVAQSQLRAEETPQQRDARLHAQRVAQSQLRAEETPELRGTRQQADRTAHSQRQAEETMEQYQARLLADQASHILRRAAESQMERQARQEADRTSQTERRVNETSQQRETRLDQGRQREQARRRARARGGMYLAAVLDRNETAQAVPHNLGPMTRTCEFAFCKAKHFQAEKGTLLHNCCNIGKVALQPLLPYPNALGQLLTGNLAESVNFRDHIRQFNNANAFASFGARSVEIPGNGPYCFKINGEVYHQATSALVVTPAPPEGHPTPKYGQLFIYDPDVAVNFRVQNQQNTGCRQLTMCIIDHVMRQVSPYVHQYRRLLETVQAEETRVAGWGGQMREYELRLLRHQKDDQRRYNPPPPTNKDCMFVVESGDGDVPVMDLAVHPRGTRGCRRISAFSMHTDPMVFPLFFPHGEPGYYIDMENAIQLPNQTKDKVTPMQFYANRIAVRDQFNPIHHGGKLFQQYVVHAYCTVESQRLMYIHRNQMQLRVECYQGLIDFVAEEAADRGLRPGNLFILPSTFTGGPRYMRRKYYDAMTLVRHFGRPDLFITFTCNPNWPEIVEQLAPYQQTSDRPDIVSRVFQLKVEELLRLIIKEKIFGTVLAYVYVIEFQKRGLPHLHSLFWLSEEDQFYTGEQVDRVISAEIPDKQRDQRLYDIITKHNIHGPCGPLNPTNVCMDNGACTKHFPKDFQDFTDITGDGYPKYRRRDNSKEGHYLQRPRSLPMPIHNGWVVPHNPFLSKTFDAHINVEMCHTILAIKYLCKYFMKGHDRARVGLKEINGHLVLDEVSEFVDTRCITPPEATWHLLGNHMHEQSHAVYELAVHLPDAQRIFFQEDNLEEAVRRGATRVTTLTAWFALNETDEFARTLLYQQIPTHYVMIKLAGNVRWKIRERGHGLTIGRVASVSPRNAEQYHLRLLLLNVRGPTSFEEIRTVNGVLMPTFRAAALALGLIVDDQEWRRCMDEARLYAMPYQLRSLFAVLLINCDVHNADELWTEFRADMIEDFRHNDRYTEEEAENLALQQIQADLQAAGTNCIDRGIPEPRPTSDQPELLEYDQEACANRGQEMFAMLNDAQRYGAQRIIEAVESGDETQARCFFVDGPGGTGKTFPYDTLINLLQGRGKKMLAVAYTGIAAILLPGGKTCHTAFRLPLNLRSDSTCNLSTREKEAMHEIDVILWDEAPMASSDMLNVIDRSLRDLMHNEHVAFGGKVVILGGDFRQVLPVVQRATRLQIVRQCLKSSAVFRQFEKITLTTNMRARPEEVNFAQWLLQLGGGELPLPRNAKTPNSVIIPRRCISQDLVTELYADRILPGDTTVYSKVLLCPINEDVRLRNEEILAKLLGEKVTFRSIDAIGGVEGEDVDLQQQMYPTEFLNTVNLAGLPPHELNLKRGAIVMLIRNLCLSKGLCNGTRMVVVDARTKVLAVQIISGTHRGTNHFIPRITLNTKDDVNVPFNLCRRQFPVKLAYAMTINKAQGQTFDKVGVFLRGPVFAHGQLYVACSRVRSVDSLYMQVFETETQGKVGDDTMTDNIVYKEVLN